jgi:hypothetical protein
VTLPGCSSPKNGNPTHTAKPLLPIPNRMTTWPQNDQGRRENEHRKSKSKSGFLKGMVATMKATVKAKAVARTGTEKAKARAQAG